MRMGISLSSLLLFTCAMFTTQAQGGFTYSESVHGELSDDRLLPTRLNASAGDNTLTGTFGPSPTPGIRDIDYVTLTIPMNHVLIALDVLIADVGGGASFIGVQTGSIISIPPSSVDPSALLGWAHFGSASAGTDLLPEIGAGAGAIGFTGPLGAGEYTFWIMELEDFRTFHYSFAFDIAVVPHPATLHIACVACFISLRRNRCVVTDGNRRL